MKLTGCKIKKIIIFPYILGNRNPEKILHTSGNGNPEKFLIFREMEFLNPNSKK